MRRPLVIGNWKMHTNRDSAVALARSLVPVAREAAAEVVICPPTPWLVAVAESVDRSILGIGAQDCSRFEDGPHTGDVSAAMLVPWCSFVLAGHSERRADNGETDEIIGAKVGGALAHGLRPVLCVGERASERDAGRAAGVVRGQLGGALGNRSRDTVARIDTVTIAYEPAWAIGTSKAATPEDASEMASIIRSWLGNELGGDADAIRVLYGGSVSADNAAAFMDVPELDGLLVGGASLDADAFAAIVGVASAR